MFGKNRVEEDLARIRHANLPDQYPDPDLPREERKKRGKPDPAERFGAKDILAMIIAAFSILLPYVAVFVAVMAFLVWGFMRVFSGG